MDQQKKAIFFALTAVLLWSTIATAFKISLRFLDPYQIVFMASLFSFLFFLGVCVFRYGLKGLWRKPSWQSLLRSALLGLMNPFLYYLVLIHAYDMITAQEAMTLNYIWPIVLAILSVPLLKQKLGGLSLVAMFISFAGIILIAVKGDFHALAFRNLTGAFLAAGSSVIWALYWIFNLKDQRDIPKKMLLNFFFGTFYSIPVVLVFSSPFPVSFSGWLAGAYLGMFEMGLTFLLWLSALKFAKNTVSVGQLIFLSPFISLLWIALVLKEPLIWSTLFGLVLIIAGIILQQRDVLQPKK